MRTENSYEQVYKLKLLYNTSIIFILQFVLQIDRFCWRLEESFQSRNESETRLMDRKEFQRDGLDIVSQIQSKELLKEMFIANKSRKSYADYKYEKFE